MKLQTNKAGYFTINAHNLELMLQAFPDIAEDLFIVEFESRNTSISFRREISMDAVEELAGALQVAGWLMPGQKNNICYALQKAVFALHADHKLPVCQCDYFEGEPKMAREWECNTVTWSYPNIQAPVIAHEVPEAVDAYFSNNSNTDMDNYLQEKQA